MTANTYIEQGARFQCVPDCGFCCKFWDIHIDAKRKDALLERPWVETIAQDLTKREGLPLFKIIGQTEQAVLQRQRGTCSFINERQLCSIHAVEGYDAKPVACQQFPFIYYQTPRGLEVFLDHTCPEVIQNKGELVRVEEIQARVSGEHILKITLPIPLTSNISLDWESYLALEDVFLKILEQPLSYEEKILHLNRIVVELSKQLSPHPNERETKTALQTAIPVDLKLVLPNLGKESAHSSKRNLYLAILIQLVESAYSGEVGPGRMGMIGLLKRILRQWKRAGQNCFHVFNFEVFYPDIQQIGFQSEVKSYKEILDRYLFHLVKRLVGTGKIPINKRVAIIATNFALVKWFSSAYAASRSQPIVTQEEIVFAIKVVEKFLSNGLFNKMSKEKNFLSNYINFLYENPSLPITMLSG